MMVFVTKLSFSSQIYCYFRFYDLHSISNNIERFYIKNNKNTVNFIKIKIQSCHLTLLTAGLAYLANVFCVNLTYVFKKEAFVEFGLNEHQLVSANTNLLIVQHIGILLGVLIFGVLADKKGRMAMLFISVFTYSIGTLLSGLVHNYYLFVVLRFIVGLGLAAELGIGLVLVCEIFPKGKRIYAVIFIAICGFIGMFLVSIFANVVYWRTLYIAGGLLGFIIMLLRFSTFESDIFLKASQNESSARKTIFSLLKTQKIYYLILSILPSYLITASSIFVGVTYFKELKITMGQSMMFFAIGGGIGFVLLAIIGYKIRSRKKTITFCIFSLVLLSLIYAFIKPAIQHAFLLLNFLFGLFIAYQFELLALTIEQFGTNLRALATTIVFGIGRASVFLFSLLIPIINIFFDDFLHSVLFLDCIVFSLAIWGISKIKEEYGKDLAFLD
ncbi:Sialic acid transporter NanT [Emticicia aquatica]|uniref:Sialic acid transporter NanT n=1 Tax=Emticicia aquatica TaxID=1681835 RepID=A0ABM9AKI0_9BACT|nr:MFS transporter [Emticicia aquatica]CAH0994246.1 Sialic acid transporter NanT [Emticicia aquatica]